MLSTTTTPPALVPLRQAMAAIEAEQPVPATLWPWALELVLTRQIWPCAHLEGYWLQGDSPHGDYILVRLGDGYLCGCKAHRRRGGLCAHSLAVALHERLRDAPSSR
jgi:hypothetical protein